jgi:riboflavin kinase/FMN adenylyltransferase
LRVRRITLIREYGFLWSFARRSYSLFLVHFIRHLADLRALPRKSCLAIGVFDGVHLGHQQIIRRTVSDARLCNGDGIVVTFDRHPNAVVEPDRVPPSIYSALQKQRAIAALGADVVLEIPFDAAFSRMSGEEFIRSFPIRLNSVCVGADFVFGHKRSGNVPLLSALGGELGFRVHGLAAVALDGCTVSSTRIREAIRTGDLDAASQQLGRDYSLAGIVTRGDQVGRTLGFPTANLGIAGLVLPPNGVYAAHAAVAGTRQPAAVNIGTRPTLGASSPSIQVEVHLLDFSGDLYDQELEIFFVKKIREEKKFASLDGLKTQIVQDTLLARSLLGG